MDPIECQASPHRTWRPLRVEGENFEDEPMGSKGKFWLQDGSQRRWLFKFARHKAEKTNGADWAEALVHVIANELGIPSACIAFATYEGARGILSRSVLERGEALIHGNELLAGALSGYDMATSRRNPQYTVANIQLALAGVRASEPEKWVSAFDQLASYLVLDALVAGRDRHHENWAVIKALEGTKHLAPSFDHGNALGFAESSDAAERIVSNPDQLDRWVRRGTSPHFPGKRSLVDVAAAALARVDPRSSWNAAEQLRRFDSDRLGIAAEMVPGKIMSEAQRRLAVKIVEHNRRRMLDALSA